MKKISTLHFLLIVFLLSYFSGRKNEEVFHSNIEKKPSTWFIDQRIFPYGRLDYDAYAEAVSIRNELLLQQSERTVLLWQFEGPLNTGGRLQDVEMESNNFSAIYVSAASGGIFKSTDAGANWNAIFDDQPSLSIGDMALAPSNQNIIYAGTGEPNCGGGSVTYDGMGIYKSIDAGSSWNYVGLDSTRNTGRIVIDTYDPNIAFAATMGDLFSNNSNRGVYRTTNGGVNWQQVLFLNDSTGAIDLAIHPLHPDTLFACTWTRVRRFTYENYGGSNCAIYRTYDGGNTWTHLTNGLPSGNNQGRIGISISPSNPDILYSIYADKSGDFIGVFKTTDGGNTWIQTNDNTLAFAQVFASYGWWFGRIKLDPVDPDIAYVVGFTLYKTSDGGNSWNFASGNVHVDHHEIFIHPLNHDLVYDANDGGLYVSNNAGSSWLHFTNLPVTQFYTSEIDFSNPLRLYGGTQDNNVIRTLTGNLNDWNSIIGGDGFYVLVDPLDNNFIYAESQYGALERSTNGGSYFGSATNGISNFDRKNWNTPVVFNPLNPKSLYYGANRLYKSTNRAQSWNVISNDLTNGAIGTNVVYGTITSIAVSPVDTNIIYAGTDDGNVWVSMNDGGNWNNISSSLPDRWVTRVVADKNDATTAYATFSGYKFYDNIAHVYRTTDNGFSWTSIAGNLPDVPVNDLIIDSFNDSILYIATDAGVFVSVNLGVSWGVLGQQLPLAPVTDLTLHEPTQMLLAATYGRGMYSLDLSLFTSEEATITVFPISFEIFPNPSHSIHVQVTLQKSAEAFWILYDQNGKQVSSGEKYFSPGKNSFTIPAETGMYFLKIQTGTQSQTLKALVL